MGNQRVTRILCAAEPAGSSDALDAAVQAAADVHAIALVGDLGRGDGDADGLRDVLRAVARIGLPTFWVPGPGDAPVALYLREAHSIEVVAPNLHGVHGTVAFAPGGHVLFGGFGGEVSDDPEGRREEDRRLSYPRWEPEYRLKLVSELDEHELVLLFATPPAHKGLGTSGSEVLAELAATYRARLVVCGGARGSETIGRTSVVAPGSLGDGHYAIADLHSREVELGEVAAGARTA